MKFHCFWLSLLPPIPFPSVPLPFPSLPFLFLFLLALS